MSNQEYDFQNPFVDEKNEQDYIQKKTQNVKKNISKKKERKERSYSWLLVFVLMLSLIGVGTYSLLQIREKEDEIADLKNNPDKSVAGVAETIEPARLSGDNFTIVFDQGVPEGYKLERSVSDFDYLRNKTALITTYLNEIQYQGEELLSGFEVLSVEYDNIYTQKEFASKVGDKLGKDYELVSNDINIPKNFKLSKIESKTENGITYYVAVTDENYYVIKIYNQTSEYSDFVEYSRFTDKIIEGIYLN